MHYFWKQMFDIFGKNIFIKKLFDQLIPIYFPGVTPINVVDACGHLLFMDGEQKLDCEIVVAGGVL
jgi:hypothetical protein